MKCSILCNTYNHEATIAQAIDGFLMQKTEYPFEILIHDDASTDSTKEIIEKYAKQYPDLIKPIFQMSNQTRLGKSVTEINLSRAQGDYIALCEGDDYWIDPLKLQRQVDILEADSSIQLVGHSSRVQNARFPMIYRTWNTPKAVLEMSVLIQNRGIVFANSSMMFRKNPFAYPSFAQTFKVADVKRVLFSALQGNVVCLEACMSVYRVGVEASWTERVRLDRDRVIKHYQSETTFYEAFDLFTEGKYHKEITLVLQKLSYLIRLHERHQICFSMPYYQSLTRFNQLKDRFHFYFPNLFQRISVLRYRYFI